MPLEKHPVIKSTSVDSDEEQIRHTKKTIELLTYNVVESVSKPSKRIKQQKSLYFETLAKVMDELNENNPRVFKGMIKRLGFENLSKREAAASLVRVFHEMHADNHYNWGRVATIYAFLRSVAQHLEICNKSDYLEEIASATNSFASERLSTWIVKQGGWDSFENFFCEKEPEASQWKGVLYTLLGLGAIANLRYLRIL